MLTKKPECTFFTLFDNLYIKTNRIICKEILRQTFFDHLEIPKIVESLGNFVKTFFVYFISPLQF